MQRALFALTIAAALIIMLRSSLAENGARGDREAPVAGAR
jgi:hypothetical protein